MIPRRYGWIINIASIAGLRGNLSTKFRTIAYNTIKGGLVNFTRALAGEWGQYGITVNAICPGFFPSKMTRATLEKIPLGRWGELHEITGAAVFLASDAASFVTGSALYVDGGWTAQ